MFKKTIRMESYGTKYFILFCLFFSLDGSKQQDICTNDVYYKQMCNNAYA